jgi:hypothetical protein
MSNFKGLSEGVMSDIRIYFDDNEEIIDVISPFKEDEQAVKGYVWVILTNYSVIFHTQEINKEPLVALIRRTDIKEIEYFEREKDILLTFVPLGKSQNLAKLTFGSDKKAELESFCEDIADFITYKKETSHGVQVLCNALSPEDRGKALEQDEKTTLEERLAMLNYQDNILRESIMESKKRTKSSLTINLDVDKQRAELEAEPEHAVSALKHDLPSLTATLKKSEKITVKTVGLKPEVTEETEEVKKPVFEQNFELKPEPAFEPEPALEPEPKLELEPEVSFEPEPEPKTAFELESAPTTEPELEPESKPVSEPFLEPELKQEQEIEQEQELEAEFQQEQEPEFLHPRPQPNEVPPLRKQVVKAFNTLEISPEIFEELPSLTSKTTDKTFHDIVLDEDGYKPISIMVITAISLVVAYIWYKFFKFIEKYE